MTLDTGVETLFQHVDHNHTVDFSFFPFGKGCGKHLRITADIPQIFLKDFEEKKKKVFEFCLADIVRAARDISFLA